MATASSRRLTWLLWAALIAVWFGTLDFRALIRPDEGRYAEIPREMVVSGDWLTPRLNAIKYFEKPALQYWATAVGYEAFGEHQWTARLWPALTGFLGIVLTWYAGRRLWNPTTGALAAAIQASMLLYVVLAQVITLDMGLSFFLQLAWTAFLFAQQGEPRAARGWMWLAWAAMALAVLTKGIVALVLTGATLVGYSLLTRDFSPWRRLFPFSGLAVFLAIAAPWFIAVSLANSEFAHFFFIHEHFERFLTKAHRRYQPDWYFVPVFILGALPWSFMLLHAALKSWRASFAGPFQPQRFLVLWSLVTFGFFSVSSSKLAPYILPVFPALALLGGHALTKLSKRALMWHLAPLLLLAAVALGVLIVDPHVVEAPDNENTAEMLAGLVHWWIAAFVLWVAALVAALVLLARSRQRGALLTLAAGSLLANLVGLLGTDQLERSHSARSVAMQVRPLLVPGVPFYSVLKYDQTLPFYIKRPVTLVEYQDELAFGLTQEPDRWIPSVAEFRQLWKGDHDAFAIMAHDTYDKLRAEGLPMQEVARDTRNIIVRKPQ